MSDRWPDLAVLELLVAVSEHGSLGAAARAVEMAQPNASRAITRLERTLGLRVIQRSTRGSTLTADGAVIVDWARSLLDAATQLRVSTDALRSQHDSQVTVAASMTVAEYLMPGWLARLRGSHAGLAIRLRVQNSEEVFDLVEEGTADIGFVESPEVRTGLRSAPVARDRLVVVVSPNHPWARRRRPLTADELAATPLVVREQGSGTRTTLDRALTGLDAVSPTLELASNAAVRVSVAAGAGPAVLSELAVASTIASGELVAVRATDIPLDRTVHAVWTGAGHLHPAAADLVMIARASLPREPDGRTASSGH